MSTKTTFKRIALVAVAALGFGMLSAVPSQAVVGSYSLAIDAEDAITTGESATAVLTQSFYATSATDSVSVSAVLRTATSATSIRIGVSDSSTSRGVASTGGATVLPSITTKLSASNGVGTPITGATAIANLSTALRGDSFTIANTTAAGTVNATYSVVLYNVQAAGTYYVDFYSTNPTDATFAAAAVTTWKIVVTAEDKSAKGNSTATLRAGEATIAQGGYKGATEGVDSTVLVSRTASATDVVAEATIWVIEKTALGTPANESLTVTSVGEAYVSAATGTRELSTKTLQMAHTAAIQVAGTGTPIYVWATGTAGTATITVSTTSGLVIGTKTITFFGSAASIAIDTVYSTVGRAGGYSTADYAGGAMDVVVKDSAGNPVTGASVTIVSGTVGAVTGGTCTDAYTGVTTDGYYTCDFTSAVGSKSGDKATLTIRVPVPLSSPTTYYSVTADVTLGGSVATETVTFDKSSYSPGEGMVVTRTAKDSSGNPVYDYASAVALTGNKNIAAIAAGSYLNGSVTTSSMYGATVLKKYTVFAPASTGSFTYSGLGGALGLVEISASATVSDDAATAAASAAGDAAAEATDAANAATDAANAAAEAADAATAAAQDAADAVAALSAQVATLISGLKAQLTALTNLVIKIQKKVKA
jgi:hypothetical protein